MIRHGRRRHVRRGVRPQLDGIQEKRHIQFLFRNPRRDAHDALRQSILAFPTVQPVEDRLQLFERKLAVVHDRGQFAGIQARRVGLVQDGRRIAGLDAQVAQGNVHLADGDGGIVEGGGRGGDLLGAEVEGAGKGVDGVDAEGRRAAVHDVVGDAGVCDVSSSLRLR